MDEHAVIVMGASAGGTTALRALAERLPADLPAAVFVVQHLYAEMVSQLPQFLSRAGPLRAVHPEDGQTIRPGEIYVAPPNLHMLIRTPGMITLQRGARENLHRPAIDPLFRTAARAYGKRTIGVVLTGTKDDGAAGLLAVKMAGGKTVVQDPADAAYAEMPESALATVERVDAVAPLAEIPGVVTRLAHEVSRNGASPGDRTLSENEGMETGVEILICPECGGALVPMGHGNLQQYRCHVGHVFGLQTLHSAYSDKVEQTLWAAMRALQEQVVLNQRMAEHTHNTRLAGEYKLQAEAAEEHAERIREIIEQFPGESVPGRPL